MFKKKIAIVGTVGIPAKYGGFETLVEYLTKYMGHKFDMTVFCSGKSYKDRMRSHNNAKLEYINLNANGVQSIFYDIISIHRSIKFADIILILGVSGCIYLPFVKFFSSKKIIVNIDGLEWKRNKWKWYAKKFLKFSEKMAVKYADTIVTDNKVIQQYVKDEYNKDSELIAYGADHVERIELEIELLSKYKFLKNKYAFSVCRIEPENNVHMILEAFREYKNLNLVFIGNWNNSKYGINLKKEYGSCKNIFLLDPIYEHDTLNQIRGNCYIYIHGHSAGGTNPSLVEAMHLGLPILAFGVQYNIETTNDKAIYFYDKNNLIRLLKNENESKLKSIGIDMKIIARKNYNWENISDKYLNLFIIKKEINLGLTFVSSKFRN